MEEDEAALIAASPRGPVDVAMLVADLLDLGVRPGSALLVHASLRSLGWVNGGSRAAVLALLDALGPAGTLVVPTHTNLSDPAHWQHPPVPPEWVDPVRDGMPAYDRATTPTRQMGAVADAVRTWPGALRSAHPQVPFAALGPAAEVVTAGHAVDRSLGESSPLARLYDLDADVLLLGVGHDRNTSLHLAEHRADWPSKDDLAAGAPLLVDGERRWVRYLDLATDTGDFPALGEALEAEGLVRIGRIGHAESRLMRQRAVVDAAVAWLPAHRR